MIHPCDKPCGNKTSSGYCQTTACINPQYSNFGTAHYDQGVQKRIITNADCLRAMSDEELATWIDHIQSDAYEHGVMETPVVDYPNIYSVWLDWMKQEAEDGKQD